MAEKRDEDELTLEELRLARAIFGPVYFLSVLLVLAVTVGVATAGYLAWPWFLAIPAGAVLIFAARVVKRYFRNILDGISRDLVIQTEFERPVRPANDFVASILRLTGGSVIIVALIMTCVAALWYFIGVGVRGLSAAFN